MNALLKALCIGLVCITCAYGAFDEDEMLFEAIELETQRQFDKARDAYLILYDETQKLEYLKEAIVLSASLDNPKATLEFANDYLAQGGQKDIVVSKVFLDCYLKLGAYDKALTEAKALIKLDDNPQIQNILGLLYIEKRDLTRAKKAFEASYTHTKSQDTLQKIIEIDLAQGNGKEAFERLDSHIEQYGCLDAFCSFSLELYARSKQTSKIEAIFKHAFDESPTIQNAQNLVLVYAHQKKFQQALEIASQFPFNHQVMLELYVLQKDFANASKQANLIYQENKNPHFLALEQIYAFESLQDKSDSRQLKAITQALQKAITMMQDSNTQPAPDNQSPLDTQDSLGFFLNFLGYMLIDYELDIPQGVEYVQKALEFSPNNPAFLDSLAWGQYKLKKCTLAKETFKKIPESEIKKEKEMQEHKAFIQKCKG